MSSIEIGAITVLIMALATVAIIKYQEKHKHTH